MKCRMSDLRNKDVVCIRDGVKLGCVYDAQIDTCTAQLISIIVCKKGKWGIFKEDETVINWSDIEVMGEDTVLVNCDCAATCKKPKYSVLFEKAKTLFD